jgi:hypothetical protein
MKYYLKEGYSEKGPLTVEDLKKLKISKTSFIRAEDSSNWLVATDYPEINRIFHFRFNGILKGMAILIIAIVLILLAISFFNAPRSSNFESDIEMEEPLPPPPSIEYTVSKHKKKFLRELFKDCNLSGEKRKLVEACDYTNPNLRNTAVSIAGKNGGSYNIGQVCDIFDYCFSNWKYVNDPKTREIVETASNTTINGLNGDCDDFAVLICSMIISIGGEARINYAYGQDGGHAFTEVNIGQTEVENYISRRYNKSAEYSGIWSRTDDEGNHWLNLDWFASHPGGKYFEYTHGSTFYILQQYCNDFNK